MTAAQPGQADRHKGRLLIVDDVFENREILKRRFERQGFHVTDAGGGDWRFRVAALDGDADDELGAVGAGALCEVCCAAAGVSVPRPR